MTTSLEPTHVKQALMSIQKAQKLPPSHPLLSFYLVQQKLDPATLPLGGYAQLLAVQAVFRESFVRVLGDESKEKNPCIDFLVHDFLTSNLYLQSFSALYYLYMRPELGLTSLKIAHLVNYNIRTVTRRITEGISYLTFDLVQRETEIRKSQRMR